MVRSIKQYHTPGTTHCPNLHSITMINTITESSDLGRKGFIWLTCANHGSSLREARVGTVAESYSVVWYIWLAQLSFFYTSQDHLPEWHCPQWSTLSHKNQYSRKCLPDMPTGQSGKMQFLSWESVFPSMSSFVSSWKELTITNDQLL